ncbi:MAG: DUF2975 domain-containing protein [Chitinophagaceae bacterium]
MKALGNKSLSTILAIVINIAWWAEWIAGTVLIAVIMIAAFSKEHISLTVPVSFSSVNFKTISPITNNTPNGQLDVMNGNFVFPFNVTLQNTLLLLAGVVMGFSVLLLITYQLKIIFLNFRLNQPFNKLNIPRIRNVGALLICFSILQWLFNICINLFLGSHFKWEEGVKLNYQFNVSFLVAGIILLIVSEIFRVGFVMEEDNNLTI